jgi:hypothetical protein
MEVTVVGITHFSKTCYMIRSLFPTQTFLTALIAWLTVLCGNAQIRDRFNDANDDGWTRYEPLAPFGAGGTYTFPVDPVFGPGYRIQAAVSPDPGTLGFGRVGSFRLDEYDSDFGISLVVTDWDNGLSQSFGTMARTRQLGLGTTDGYLLHYSTGGFLNISRVDNDSLNLLNSSPIILDPAKQYVLYFFGFGPGLHGEVAEVMDAANPLAVVGAVDSTYGYGFAGLYVQSLTANGTADATFDSVTFAPLIPEPSTWSLIGLSATALLCLALLRRYGAFCEHCTRNN